MVYYFFIHFIKVQTQTSFPQSLNFSCLTLAFLCTGLYLWTGVVLPLSCVTPRSWQKHALQQGNWYSSLHRGCAVAAVGAGKSHGKHSGQRSQLLSSGHLLLGTEKWSPPVLSSLATQGHPKCRDTALQTVHLWPLITQFVMNLLITLPQVNSKNNSIKGS